MVTTTEAKKPQPRYAIYWMTRNKTSGYVSSKVKIWLCKPERFAMSSGDIVWLAWDAKHESALYQEWSLDQCLIEVRVYPDDDIQCIKVGDPT